MCGQVWHPTTSEKYTLLISLTVLICIRKRKRHLSALLRHKLKIKSKSWTWWNLQFWKPSTLRTTLSIPRNKWSHTSDHSCLKSLWSAQFSHPVLRSTFFEQPIIQMFSQSFFSVYQRSPKIFFGRHSHPCIWRK